MSWYYDVNKGEVYSAEGLAAAHLNGIILVQEHDLVPGQMYYGPYSTQTQANAAKVAHPRPDYNPVDAVAKPLATATSEVANYFVRGAEIILGIVLVAIALNAILKQQTGVDVAAKIGSAATKGAALAATKGAE